MRGQVAPRSFQPGLFDRRAERLSDADRAAGAEANRRQADQVAALSTAAALTLRPAELLLVLVP